MTSSEEVKVLYIIGWGRSGSTIMGNLLGEIDGFFHGGELTYLWERGLLEGRLCGCGQVIPNCELWSDVLRRSYGNDFAATLDAKGMVQAQRDGLRVRHTWQLLKRPADRLPQDAVLKRYSEAMLDLYRQIATTTGARVVIDSSKRPSDAALLRLLPGITPYYVHLVRDPRAVAFSWTRKKAQLDRHRPALMSPHSVLDSAMSWLSWNLAAEALRKRAGTDHFSLVRYEDFVTRPHEVLEGILRLVGETATSVPLSDDGTAHLSTNHTVSGNPDRFSTSRVKLREDREWRSRQATGDRLLTTLVALPLLHRYHYAVRG
ncbi:MAG: sulfotransferase [Actinomycetota bacterium]|nr:sulfotransferase [Actinomycetota bacterium]